MPKNALTAGAPPGPHWGSSRRSPVPDLLVGWGGGHQSQCPIPSALRSSCPPWKPDLELATVLLPSTNRGFKSHLFGPTSQLRGNFNGLYLPNQTRCRQSVKCVDNYKGSPRLSQNVMNFGPQTASNSACILPTLRKFCILLHCQASQTEISERNSTNFAK